MRTCRYLVLFGAASFSIHSISLSQIVVGKPGDPRPAKMGRIYCSSSDYSRPTIVSGIIWGDVNNRYSGGFRQSFHKYVLSNYGRGSLDNVSCLEYDSTAMSFFANIRENRHGMGRQYILSNWTGGYPVSAAEARGRTVPAETSKNSQGRQSPVATPKGPTDSELKYQREMADYRKRLAEIERIKAERDSAIARNAADLAAKRLAADRAIAEHKRKAEQAAAARRQYEKDLAAYKATISQEGKCRTIDEHGRTADCAPKSVRGE